MRSNILLLVITLSLADILFSEFVNCSSAKDATNEPSIRIVGGREAMNGEAPYFARLLVHYSDSSNYCGGVILDRTHILTTGHCLKQCRNADKKRKKLADGDHSDKKQFEVDEALSVDVSVGDNEVTIKDVKDMKTHEKFVACENWRGFDIALIKLNEKLEFKFTTDEKGSVYRVNLPRLSTFYSANQQVTASGYGRTSTEGDVSETLQLTNLTLIDVNSCEEFNKGNRAILCALSKEGNKGICHGDSGGPIVRFINGWYELVGLASYATSKECAKKGAPGAFTRVASYFNWIVRNV